MEDEKSKQTVSSETNEDDSVTTDAVKTSDATNDDDDLDDLLDSMFIYFDCLSLYQLDKSYNIAHAVRQISNRIWKDVHGCT